MPRTIHRLADGRSSGHRVVEQRHACARRAVLGVSLYGSVRIAYDVTPLSHPRTGVGNYILGALKGMLAVGGDHELVVFGPVSIRGRATLHAALEGLALERRTVTVPFAHAVRRLWSALVRPPTER